MSPRTQEPSLPGPGRAQDEEAAHGEGPERRQVTKRSAREMTAHRTATEGDVNRSIIETAMDGFWLVNDEGLLLEVNQAYCRMSGYSRSELLGMRILDLDLEADQTPDRTPFVKRAIEQGEQRFETRHRRKDGSTFDVEASVQYRPAAGGQLVMFLRDITERKKTAEALRASEERYRSMLSTSPDVVGLTDLQGRIQMVSPAILKLLRCEREGDVLGRPLTDFLVPADRPRALERIAAILGGTPPSPTEYTGLRPDGSTVAVEVNSQFIRGADGRPTEMILLVRDVTARKAADAALRASEERHRSILNASPDNITITDLTGRIVLVSPVGVATMGYANEAEVVGRSLYDFIAEEEHPRAAENIARMFQGILTGPEEYRGLRADGSAIDIEANGEFIRGSEGEPRELVFIVRDVTERKRARAELSASEERHRTILQQSHDMIAKLTAQVPGVVYQYRLFADGRSCFPFASPGVRDIYEFTPEEVRNDATPVFERLHPDDRERITALILESARTLDPFHCEFRVILPRQGLRWRLCDAMPERMDDGGTLWHGIISDITERKQAEDLLRLSLKEKEGLLREVHHRVKNNLQVISSLLRLETSRSAAPDTKRVLGDMQGRILSMAVLHETLYRSDRFGQVDLGGYLRQLAQQLFRAAASSTRLRLELQPVYVEIDQAIPCGLIVNELLTNSLKHAFTEGTAGEVAMSLALSPQGEVQITVADTGVGLPIDFDTKRVRSLGLVLVTDLVRQIGGSLAISPGPGAAFGVTFKPALTHFPGPPDLIEPTAPSPGRTREGP